MGSIVFRIWLFVCSILDDVKCKKKLPNHYVEYRYYCKNGEDDTEKMNMYGKK